jgi:hypothetical protein
MGQYLTKLLTKNFKAMKKLHKLIAILSFFILISNNVNGQKNQNSGFEESVAIITQGRINVKNSKMSARAVKLINFNKSYKLPKKIFLNKIELTDDGKGYDKIANDGVYTSIDLYPNLKGNPKEYIITFSAFKYQNTDAFNKFLKTKSHVIIKCHVEYFYRIPYIICEIDLNVEW